MRRARSSRSLGSSRSCRVEDRDCTAQDPNELFDLYDEGGRPLGIRKARAEVHRDGDWHASLHLWVVLRARDGADASVVLQRRGHDKDTWPGALDVAVTGHFATGESLDDALREAKEEIGLVVDPSEVVQLGVRHRRDRPSAHQHDNEHQRICAVVRAEPLEALAPARDELAAILALPWDSVVRLMTPPGEPVDAMELSAETGAKRVVRARPDELVAAPDGYYARALASLDELLRGFLPTPWELGARIGSKSQNVR